MRRTYPALAVPVVAGALALAWWSPWSSGPNAITRAREAFGTEPVVHVLAATGIDPRGPAMRPMTSGESIEVWYDASQPRTHTVVRRGTKVVLDRVEGVLPRHLPPVADAAPLYGFVTAYRSGLAEGSYHPAGTDRIQGRLVLWLRSPSLLVAVDPASYLPIWLRSPHSTLVTLLTVAETKPYDPADFLTAKQKKPRHL